MFRAILSLIIRSILTVIKASGLIHMCCQLLSWQSRNSVLFLRADHDEFVNIMAFSKDNLMDKSIYQWRN